MRGVGSENFRIKKEHAGTTLIVVLNGKLQKKKPAQQVRVTVSFL